MYKTTWTITIDDGETITLKYYHFGKSPKFPADYMEENHVYEIEMTWNFKLIISFRTFFKCLFHDMVISNR